MASTSQLISGYAHLLKSRVSKYALYGALISITAVITATILSSYFQSSTVSLTALLQTQRTNPVLWVLDSMPFVFAFWGQYVSTVMGYEAGAMVIEETRGLKEQTVTLKRQAIHDATHDSLTDLPNRILLYDRLEQAIKTAKREEKKVAVLLLDLDRFKEINDALGHYSGDRLLKQVSMRLSGVIRDSDTLARLGGDEFAVLLPSITESAIMADPERALEILTRIAEMGVRLSIDDFGTGYSSLSYLKKLPVSEIKIDKSFVMEMLRDENDAKIVHATIELGHNLGLAVVAEGVENEETFLKLKSLGCDFYQGYYISKPINATEFSVWYDASVWGKGGGES